MNKDGHTDVASSRRMMQTIIEDAKDILNALPSDEETSLPTWWTNKLAVSSAYINSARDYLVYGSDTGDTPVTSTCDDCDMEDCQCDEIEEVIEDIMDEMQEVTEVLDDDMMPPSYRYITNAS